MSSASSLIIFLFFIQACAGTKKESSENTEANEPQPVTQSENDSIPKPPPPAVSELGPGQAKVMGHITILKEDILCFRVESIKGYGSATPPIAVNDTLSIQVGSNITFGKESKAVLIIQHNISSDSSQSPTWSFIKLAN